MARYSSLKRSMPSEEDIRAAVYEVLQGKLSIRKASVAFELSRSTLAIYVKKFKVLGRLPHPEEPLKRRTEHHFQIIPSTLETKLACFLTASSLLQQNCGLSPDATRILTYWFCQVNKIPTPLNWNVHQKASCEWLKGFLKRHPSLVIHCSGRRETLPHLPTPESESHRLAKAVVKKRVELDSGTPKHLIGKKIVSRKLFPILKEDFQKKTPVSRFPGRRSIERIRRRLFIKDEEKQSLPKRNAKKDFLRRRDPYLLLKN